MSSATMQYKRPDVDGGVLTDEKEIAYYKQVQTNDVLNNLMLGDFNQNGNYIVKKDIINELISLTKVLQHTYGKTIFCVSAKEIKNYGHFEFAVKIERLEGGKATASLELLEAINKIGGYYQNINTVLLATYTDTYDMDFLKKVYQVFHVISKEDDYKGRKKLENETIDEILARKDYLQALQRISELNLSDTERKFYEARIAVLSKSGEYGKAVLVRLQLEANKINKLFLKPNSPQYHQKMNQLLDKVLEDMKKNLDKGLVDKLRQTEADYIKATQAEMLRAKDDLFKSKTLPENMVLTQLNQQKKAESVKESPAIKYTSENFRGMQKEASTKILDKDVEIVQNNKGQFVNLKPEKNIEEAEELGGGAFGETKFNARTQEKAVQKEDIKVEEKLKSEQELDEVKAEEKKVGENTEQTQKQTSNDEKQTSNTQKEGGKSEERDGTPNFY